MRKNVIIIGASGHVKVLADIILKNKDNLIGFLDDCPKETSVLGYKVLGKVEDYKKYADDTEFIIGIGNNAVRKRIAGELACKWYTAIHPSAQIAIDVTIDEGSCVAANAVINTSAQIGKHVILNTATVVEHDCKVGDFCHLSPNATLCGVSSIGENVWIGAGATVNNVLEICSNTIIASGAAVHKSITEEGTYMGVPARKKSL